MQMVEHHIERLKVKNIKYTKKRKLKTRIIVQFFISTPSWQFLQSLKRYLLLTKIVFMDTHIDGYLYIHQDLLPYLYLLIIEINFFFIMVLMIFSMMLKDRKAPFIYVSLPSIHCSWTLTKKLSSHTSIIRRFVYNFCILSGTTSTFTTLPILTTNTCITTHFAIFISYEGYVGWGNVWW